MSSHWISTELTGLKSLTVFLCGSVVEHCASSAKGCGFDSQGTHILMKMYNLDAIVSRFAKCININVIKNRGLKNFFRIFT